MRRERAFIQYYRTKHYQYADAQTQLERLSLNNAVAFMTRKLRKEALTPRLVANIPDAQRMSIRKARQMECLINS